jgi:hypothetical protein
LNFGKTFKIFIVIMLCIGSSLAIINTSQLAKSLPIKAALPTDWPLVYFTNGTANSYDATFTGNVNDTISIALVVSNLTDNIYVDPDNPQISNPLGNLNGFDVQMSWDPTILKLLDYTVTVTVEDYPNPVPPSPYAGILHQEAMKLVKKVNETDNIPDSEPGTMAWFSYGIMPGAEVFNGNGTFFTMTFNVTKAGSCSLKLTKADLAGEGGTVLQVKCHAFDGEFRTAGAPVANFTFWPDVGVVNKPMSFNASTSYTTSGADIYNYIWNFGDSNATTTYDPVISHSYNAAQAYTVSLVVNSSFGVSSSPKTEQVTVVNKRNVRIVDVTPSKGNVLVNDTIDIDVRVEDDGDARESCTLGVYYNATLVDLGDISAASWTKIDETSVSLKKDQSIIKSVTWNTTGVLEPDARYCFLANITAVPYENVSDNSMVSMVINMTSTPLHNVVVEDLQIGWSEAFKSPVLDGETVTFQITVLNDGTGTEPSVNVTLYSNGSMLKSWTQSILAGETVELTLDKVLPIGFYNISTQATIADDKYPNNNFMNKTVRVIATPKLSLTWDPLKPLVNQTVTLNASASYHQEPGASLTQYQWQIFNPAGTLVNTTIGAGLVSLTYKFHVAGNWRVILTVTDNYKITYNHARPKTSSYQIEKTIEVPTGGGGEFPIEYIAAIIIVIVAVVAILAVIVLRRRRPVKT